MKCIHWIFHELPVETHKGVMAKQRTHMDMVVARVEREMNITWATKKEGESKRHRNCIQHTYSRIMNEKKQTIVKEEGNTHKRRPMVRHPRTYEASGCAPNYKKGMKQYYWQSKSEGENVVSVKDNGCLMECVH